MPTSKVACLALSSASLQYLSRSSLHRLAGLPRRLFWSYIVYGLQLVYAMSIDRLEAVNVPCPEPFHLSHIVLYIYDLSPLPEPDVDLSVLECDDEFTSFHFCLCGGKFVLCLFGECLGICAIRHNWQRVRYFY